MWVASERPDVPLSNITRMAVDAKQRIFAPDFKESVVYVFAADGSYLTKIGRKGRGPGGEVGVCRAAPASRSELGAARLV